MSALADAVFRPEDRDGALVLYASKSSYKLRFPHEKSLQNSKMSFEKQVENAVDVLFSEENECLMRVERGA